MNQIIQLAERGNRPLGDRTGAAMRRLAVVTPVLDDWDSFATLVQRIAHHSETYVDSIEIVAVDDGSIDGFDPSAIVLPDDGCVSAIRVVHLALNLGHQRAIAAGLVTVSMRKDLDGVIVMDSDGEDRPEEIPLLLAASRAAPDHVILAHRARRSEPAIFRTGYGAYKFLFRLLTGRGISFGNFSLLPIAAVRRLVHMPELWNNLPAAIMRSRLAFTRVDTMRGKRYAGRPKMNFAGLVIHGLSAMSVYTDLIFVRVLLGAAAVSLVAFLAICGVLTIRLGTSLAIPGWATTVFGDLVIILLQAMLMIVATTLMVLAGRSARPIVPAIDAQMFIQSVADMMQVQPLPLYGVTPE